MRAGPEPRRRARARALAARRALPAHALRPDDRRRALRGAGPRVDRRRPARRRCCGSSCATRRARPAQARWAVGMRSSGGALKPSGVRRFRFPRPAVPQLPGLYTQPGWTFDPSGVYAFGDRAILRDGLVMATFPGPGRASSSTSSFARAAGRCCRRRSFGLAEYRVALGPRGTRRLDFAVPSQADPGRTPAALELRAAPFAAHRDAMLARLEGDIRAGDAAHPPRAPRAGRVLREPHAHPAAALPAARRRLGAAGQQAALPRVLAARRVGHDAGARPRRAAPRGRRERRLLRSLAARRRPVHLARGPARRPRPGDVGDRRARAAQRRPRVRPRRAAVARPRGRLARPGAQGRRARPRAALGPARQRARRRPPRGRRLLGRRGARGGGRRRADARRRARAREDWRPSSSRCARPCASAWPTPPRATAARSRPRWTAPAAGTGGTSGRPGPRPVLDPSSALVTRTLARARGHFREGLATYGEFHNLHHYLGFRVWQTELVARRAGAGRAGPLRLARPHDEHERRLRDRRAAVRAALGRRQPRAPRLVRRRARRAAAQHARARVGRRTRAACRRSRRAGWIPAARRSCGARRRSSDPSTCRCGRSAAAPC